jgi:hypothetical protein
MDPHIRRNILLALAFLAGCAAARVQWVPPALAQTDTSTQRWDYYCFRPEVGLAGVNLESVTAQLKAAGQQGWELVTVDSALDYCFKRPLR